MVEIMRRYETEDVFREVNDPIYTNPTGAYTPLGQEPWQRSQGATVGGDVLSGYGSTFLGPIAYQGVGNRRTLTSISSTSDLGAAVAKGAQFVDEFYNGGAILRNAVTDQPKFATKAPINGGVIPHDYNQDYNGKALPWGSSRELATGEVTYKSGGYNPAPWKPVSYSSGWQNSGGGISGSYSSGWINVR